MTTYADSSDVLTGGRWMPDKHGVQRWVPDSPAPAAPLVLACPECLATVDEPCLSQAGNERVDHDVRLTPLRPKPPAPPAAAADAPPRRCECGAELEHAVTADGVRRKLPNYCSEECRVAARRASWRKYAAKRSGAGVATTEERWAS